MPSTSQKHPDLLTLAGVSATAYAISNIVHEGLGHGGACLLVGCKPLRLTSLFFEGDRTGLSDIASRIIPAGGSIANLVAASLALGLLARMKKGSAATWLFLWLLATISLMQATGYLLFSGIGGIGDWAAVIAGWPGQGLWRAGMAIIGGVSYWWVTAWSMRRLSGQLGSSGNECMREAYRFTIPAYITGGLLYVIAGLPGPGGLEIVLISGVAASFGGTSGLAWGPRLLRRRTETSDVSPLRLTRDWRWATAGLLSAAMFILVIGTGLHF